MESGEGERSEWSLGERSEWSLGEGGGVSGVWGRGEE